MNLFKQSLTLIALALALSLTACSNSSSNGKGGVDADPYSKPANPVSEAYAQGIMQTWSQSEQVVPGEAAIFDGVIDGTEIKPINDWSPERRDALSKLNQDGQNLLQSIQANCQTTGPDRNEEGELGVGKTQTIQLSMGLIGDSRTCPLNSSHSAVQATTFTNFKPVDQNGNGQIVVNSVSTQKQSMILNDRDVANLVGAKSMKLEFKMSSVAQNDIVAGQQQIKADGQMTGNLDIRLANGDVISGPINGVMKLTENLMTMTVIFSGKTPQGDLKVAFVGDSNGKSELIINGKKMDGGFLNPGFTSMNSSVMSRLKDEFTLK